MRVSEFVDWVLNELQKDIPESGICFGELGWYPDKKDIMENPNGTEDVAKKLP